MSTHHAAVWLDHREAKIFHVNSSTFQEATLHPSKEHVHLHRKSGPLGEDTGRRAPEDQNYYHDVVKALSDAEEVLVMGPATAKLELIKHVHKHDHGFAAKIVGVETVDHPTDGQLIAYIRRYFEASDRMH